MRKKARREELIRELEELERAGEVGLLDEARVKRELKTRLANMRGLFERHVSSARRLLLFRVLDALSGCVLNGIFLS
jgi:hypothetical protein